jgi:DNA polymerase III alpha subunit
MAAVLSNRGGFYDTCAYVEEARRLGLTLLPPDINESEYRFTASATPTGNSACGDLVTLSLSKGDRQTAGSSFGSSVTLVECLHTQMAETLPCNQNHRAQSKLPHVGSSVTLAGRGWVRVGLMQVKHLSRNAIDSILEQRKNRPYASLEDFLSRVDIGESEAESLIRCGAIDMFARPRPQLLWQLKLFKKTSIGRNDGLFAPSPVESIASRRCLASITLEYSQQEKLRAELECLDLTVSGHLLTLYGVQIEDAPDGAGRVLTVSEAALGTRRPWPRSVLPIIAARDLSRHAGRLVTLVGWMITAKRTRTGKRELMKFMTLEDPTACFEVTLFPKIYRQFGVLIHDRGPYIVRGRVERDGKCCTLTALWLGRVA